MQETLLQLEEVPSGAATICEPILRALPSWFGIEDALVNYVRMADLNPTVVARLADEPIGFLTTVRHSRYSAEVYVMAVAAQHHRAGVGTRLLDHAEQRLRIAGCEYLQVKTLADTHPDEGYRRTRAFYMARGFRPLEVFPRLWDEGNPCLLLVKAL